MRILIISADYEPFLASLYGAAPDLTEASYADQQAARAASLFGMADFYSRNLRALGHHAVDVHSNNPWMQAAWVKENRPPSARSRIAAAAREALEVASQAEAPARRIRRTLGTLRRLGRGRRAWLLAVLEQQIAQFSPDVILNQAMDWVPTAAVRSATRGRALVVGQIAAPLPTPFDFRGYDLVISSLPNFVSQFRQRGVTAEYQPLGFESTIPALVGQLARDIPVSFVGSISPHHQARVALLEELARSTDFRFWGPLGELAGLSGALRQCYQGVAWGRDMYTIMARSQVTVNQHIVIAGRFANNQRLYEATGMGTALVTDRKENLHELFDVGNEVLDYDSLDCCVERVVGLLADHPRRLRMATAGQERTMTSHTYAQRMTALADRLEASLASV